MKQEAKRSNRKVRGGKKRRQECKKKRVKQEGVRLLESVSDVLGIWEVA